MPILFFLVALLYASIGFGGGSSYIALMAIMDWPHATIPVIALLCNIVVVSGGAWHFGRAGHVSWRAIFPFLLASVPMAYCGGRMPIERPAFLLLLGSTLCLAGAGLIGPRPPEHEDQPCTLPAWPWVLLTGGSLGFLSGLVGIGGGIFLAPLLLFFRWMPPRQTAGACAVFILVNSLAGLLGQLGKPEAASRLWNHWPLFAAVLLGGQIGSRIGSVGLSQAALRRLTGLLVLAVGLRVLIRLVLGN